MNTLLETLMNNIGWIAGVLFLAVAFLGSVRYAASRWKKVPPSRVGIIYGRKNTYKVPGPDGKMVEEQLGFRLLTGGGSIVLPFVENYSELDLSARLTQIEVKNITTQGGAMVNAKGTATLMIGTDTPSLIAATRNFEGKENAEINNIIRDNLEGQLRAILGTLTIEDLIGDRDKLNQAVLKCAESELLKLGVRVTIFTIQQIWDDMGYIESLGKKRTAEVKRDATIGEAQAERDASIESSNAKREAELTNAENAVKVALAQKERDVQIAQFKAITDRESAIAAQSGAIATAEKDKEVRQKKVEAEATETEARIRLAEQETLRTEKELQYKIIKPAEAKKDASIIEAEGARQTQVIQAEGAKQKQVIEAEAAYEAATKQAEATKTKAEAEGTATAKRGQGEADATRAKLTAEADGDKAKRLATAAGVEAELKANAAGKEAGLLAEAKGTEAKLLAEAKGKEQLAIALAQLDDTGKLLQILTSAPEVLEAAGNAVAKALGKDGLANVFGQMAAPLGNVDNISIVDIGGGGNGSGSGALSKFAGTIPNLFFQFLTQAKALGFEKTLENYGITSDLLKNLISKTNDVEKEPVAALEVKN